MIKIQKLYCRTFFCYDLYTILASRSQKFQETSQKILYNNITNRTGKFEESQPSVADIFQKKKKAQEHTTTSSLFISAS
jgi:hypothetical protein